MPSFSFKRRENITDADKVEQVPARAPANNYDVYYMPRPRQGGQLPALYMREPQ